MALQLFEGFENDMTGDVSISVGGTGPSLIYVTGRGGIGRAAYGYGTSGTPTTTLTALYRTPSSGVYAGIGLRFTGNAMQTNVQFMSFREGATTHVALRRNAAGFLELVTGAGVVLATATVAIDMTIWNHYGMEAVIDDAVGRVKVQVNGTTIMNVTGVDTRNGGTGIVDRMIAVSAGMGASTGSNHMEMDDVYLGDLTGPSPHNALLGDCAIEMVRPNGNGASSQWVGSDGNSVDNYLLVDDVNATADYVQTDTPGARDLYALSDLPGLGKDVLAAQTIAYVAKSDGGHVNDLLGASRSPAGTVDTELLASGAAISTSFAWFTGSIRTKDPDDVAWTQTSIAAAQAGIEHGPNT